MTALLRALAGLVLGIVILAGLLYFLVLSNVLERLVTAEVYHTAISETDAYNRVYDEVLADEALRDKTVILFGGFEFEAKAESVALLREILPPEYLQEQTEDNISRFIGYVRGDTDKLEIYIDLKEPLERVEPATQAEIHRLIEEIEIAEPGLSPGSTEPIKSIDPTEPAAPIVVTGMTDTVCSEDSLQRLADEAAGPVAQLSEGRLPESVPSLELLTRECREQEFDHWFDRVVSDPAMAPQASRILRDAREELRQPFVAGDTRAFLRTAAPPLVEPLIDEAIADVRQELQVDDRLDVIEFETPADEAGGFTIKDFTAEDLANEDLTMEDIEDRAGALRELVSAARGPGKYIALLLAAVGSLLLAAVHLPRPAAMLGWPGAALAVAAGVCLGAGFALHSIVPSQLKNAMTYPWPFTVDVPASALNLAGDLLESLGRHATTGFVTGAVVVISLGAALMVVSAFLDPLVSAVRRILPNSD